LEHLRKRRIHSRSSGALFDLETMASCCERCWLCCRNLVALSLRYSNYVVLVVGVVLLLDGIYLLGEEKGGLLGWLVLLLGVMSVLSAGFGIQLSKQDVAGKWQTRCYLFLLMVVAVPQLSMGVAFLADSEWTVGLLVASCARFEHMFSHPSSKIPCDNQVFCTSEDTCLCDCDERCRFCQYDIRESQAYYMGHHQLVLYSFTIISTIEFFALFSACIFKRCTVDGELGDIIEMNERGESSRPDRDSSVLDAMKAKYGYQSRDSEKGGLLSHTYYDEGGDFGPTRY